MSFRDSDKWPHLKYEDIGFEPAAGPDNPEACLHASIVICGRGHHLEAYQVTEDDEGRVTAVDPYYQDHIKALYTMANSSLATTTINGKLYVMGVHPHAR